ncbi:MAG: hypothetical protein ACOYJY_00655 [Acutalibacteraceae bacterium]
MKRVLWALTAALIAVGLFCSGCGVTPPPKETEETNVDLAVDGDQTEHHRVEDCDDYYYGDGSVNAADPASRPYLDAFDARMEDKYGHDNTIEHENLMYYSYKVISSQKTGDYDFRFLRKTLSEYYGYAEDSITEAYSLEIDVRVDTIVYISEVDDYSDDVNVFEDTWYIHAVKVDGEWELFRLDFDRF